MINYILGLFGIIIVAIIIGTATYLIIESITPKDKNKKQKDCKKTRWGCCDDNFTAKYDQTGTNCITQKINFS